MKWNDSNPNGLAFQRDGKLTATVTFRGLPERNSDFGKKRAVICWSGQVCDEKEYEVFFPKMAINHPDGQVGSPNWFYYWKEGAVCSIPSNAKFANDLDVYGYWSRTNGLTLCNLAAEEDASPYDVSALIYITNLVYRIECRPSEFCNVSTSSVGIAGFAYYVTNNVDSVRVISQKFTIGGNGKGIGCVAMTVRHELGHCNMNEISAGSTDIVNKAWDGEELDAEKFGSDSIEAAVARLLRFERELSYGDCDAECGDGVPDGRERDGIDGCFSNDWNPDTYRLSELISECYSTYGDEEIRMRLLEVGDLSDMYDEKRDWANPGCQSKNKFGPLRE